MLSARCNRLARSSPGPTGFKSELGWIWFDVHSGAKPLTTRIELREIYFVTFGHLVTSENLTTRS